jgi:predicted component of type VI protein secretion system
MPFEAKGHAYVTDALNIELADPRNRFYLAIKAEMDSQELVSLVVDHGKASSRTRVPTLVRFETEGLRLEHMAAAPTEVAARAGCEYFKVEPHGAEWTQVREEYAFAVDLGKLEHADLWLHVVTPED